MIFQFHSDFPHIPFSIFDLPLYMPQVTDTACTVQCIILLWYTSTYLCDTALLTDLKEPWLAVQGTFVTSNWALAHTRFSIILLYSFTWRKFLLFCPNSHGRKFNPTVFFILCKWLHKIYGDPFRMGRKSFHWIFL